MVEFSQRSQRFQASAIRELFKLMADPEIIPLSGGSPADESFPLAEIRTIIDDLLATQGSALLQYGITTAGSPCVRPIFSICCSPRVFLRLRKMSSLPLVAPRAFTWCAMPFLTKAM